MTKQDYIDLIKAECIKVDLDANLFCAIVTQESAWKPNAVRYEKNYNYLSLPSKYAALEGITESTETILQKISFGLCQLIGANAREMGYLKPLMTLIDPVNNIPIGVIFFKKRCDIYPEIKDKISAYNAGSPIKKDGKYINQDYVDKVYGYYQALSAH